MYELNGTKMSLSNCCNDNTIGYAFNRPRGEDYRDEE